MKTKLGKFVCAPAAILALAVAGFMSFAPKTAAQNPGEAANGEGTLLVQNDSGDFVRRQFSFSARRYADGSVKGNAVLHNPAFTNENGQKYQLQIDIHRAIRIA